MAQIIKDTKVSKTNYEYETFDFGSKALMLDESKEKDVFAAIDQLGLAGQKQLIERGAGSIIPFPKMTAAEERVWEEYCPDHKKLEDYSATLIPFEILTFITLVDQRGFFKNREAVGDEKPMLGWIEIWSESREDIDPLVVGRLGASQYSADKYLLGRWGISLRPFEEIRKVVMESWKAKRKAEAEAKLSTLDVDAIEHFNGGWVR